MAAQSLPGEDLSSSNIAGMSKNQLYDIMSQMKTLIDQNQQQARHILTQNPKLTRALFQAQIMLGMVKPPQVIPNIQPAMPQTSSVSVQQDIHPSLQGGRAGLTDQSSVSQSHIPSRKQQNLPAMPSSSGIGPSVSQPSLSLPSHPQSSIQQPKGHQSLMPPMSLQQSSQVSHLPPAPLRPLQSQMHTASGQMQPLLPTSGVPQMSSLQPPLPPQQRPSMPGYHHQQQQVPNVGYQHSIAPQMPYSQSMFHPGIKNPAGIGPPYAHGQPPVPNQPPPQSYQSGSSHLGADWSAPVVGSSRQVDRVSSWTPGPAENTASAPLPGPPPGQMGGPGSQLPGPPSLTPDMEKALLQQVMSLTPDQINQLPPEQRQQVLQLQQMLRQ